MSKPQRLDAELVRRGLAPSRTLAKRAIESGRVEVAGIPVDRASALVHPEAPIAVDSARARFVSRGGEKLVAALDRFDVAVRDRRWLDAGASTGGFTDCLLQRGASEVIAVDVGYGQFDWSLRNDPRVTVMERTNVRSLGESDLPWTPDGVTADLAFISLRLVLPAMIEVVAEDGDLILLVKPQFEVGKGSVRPGGVISDPALWLSSVQAVVDAAEVLGWGLVDATASPLVGPAGNREFFVHLRRGVGDSSLVARAIEGAP